MNMLNERILSRIKTGAQCLLSERVKYKARQIAAMMVKASSVTSSDVSNLSPARLNKPQGLDLR
jgi:hypothetical protein